ncbi:conserved hypothetical protein [Altererythrobacter sp. B11]|uniref:DUF418 domain-containing protein n=1 Tax=Altererythrobacter sp. B11 TaxID=2060312 RepID=UPI000DC72C35|nr:DUF418 domain-containing protein [Altererythrobacter sp. B11]BBC71759.1 conserved hypothetical protein [Altererythrobacter sp. B11]
MNGSPAEVPLTGAPGAGRIVPLDALRGLAVMGIVAMNVFAFAMPGAAYYNPAAYNPGGRASPVELVLWAASYLLIEDKFRTLFAMMFGAGVAILLEKPGPSRLRAHYGRMAVLFAIGFLHALLLFSGDVLRLYALAGVVLPLCARWRARSLWIACVALMLLYMAAGSWIGGPWMEYWWRVATVPGTDPSPLAPAEYAFGADPAAIERGLALGRETLKEHLARRLSAPLSALYAAALVLPTTLAGMLAGMACWRNGLLAGQWSPGRSFRLAAKLAVVSIPPLGLLITVIFWSGFDGAVVGTSALVWSAPFDLLLGIGWAALAMGLFVRAGAAAWVSRLAAVGRMALTNYLLTSVILSAVFASWGLGLFGEVSRLATYGIALIPPVLMLLWSPAWLRHFRQGPAEWLWRGLAQARFLPFRR